MVQFEIAGDPVPKARARTVAGEDGRARSYTPSRTAAAEAAIGWRLRELYPGIEPDPDSEFVVVAHFARATHAAADLDNLLKLVCDACNGLVWADDRQIVSLSGALERGVGQAAARTSVVIRARLPA